MALVEKKIDTLQAVELGDGVEITLRVAGPFARAMALVIDYLIISGVLIVLGIVTSIVAIGANGNIATGLMLLALFVLSWGYFSLFEIGKKAATPGKRTMGIRVVDRSGNRASGGQVLVRNILRYVDMLPGLPSGSMGIFIGGYGAGLMTCFLSKKFQRLGDLVANTVVVYDKPVKHGQSLLPPALESVAPPVALNREEQAAIAAFKNRAGLWSEERRIELANHASTVTGENGRAGFTKLLGMAHWLDEGK